jgi:hypothetical protein
MHTSTLYCYLNAAAILAFYMHLLPLHTTYISHCVTIYCIAYVMCTNRDAAWEGWEGVPLDLRQGVAQFGDVVQYPLSDVVKNDLQVLNTINILDILLLFCTNMYTIGQKY